MLFFEHHMLFNSLHLNETMKIQGMVCMSHRLIFSGKNFIVSRDYGQGRLMYNIICKNKITSDAIHKRYRWDEPQEGCVLGPSEVLVYVTEANIILAGGTHQEGCQC